MSEADQKRKGLFGRMFSGKGDAAKSPEPPASPPPASAEATNESAPAPGDKTSWFQRLKAGLGKTSSKLTEGITGLFTKRKLDANTLEDLEDLLIQSDLGVAMAGRITSAIGKGRFEKGISPDEVRAILADEVEKVLAPSPSRSRSKPS